MPRGRPRQLQSATNINTTNAPNAANAPRTINFNYSENFNRITELFVENYIEWTTNILYLLCINNCKTMDKNRLQYTINTLN